MSDLNPLGEQSSITRRRRTIRSMECGGKNSRKKSRRIGAGLHREHDHGLFQQLPFCARMLMASLVDTPVLYFRPVKHGPCYSWQGYRGTVGHNAEWYSGFVSEYAG